MKRHGFVVSLTSVVLLANCGGGSGLETSGPRSACVEAFAAAAAVDEMHDSVSDLYPAIRVCTLAEWRTEFQPHGGLGFIGSADQVLANICLATEVAAAPLCAEVP